MQKKVLTIISFVLALFIFCSIFFLVRANRPMNQAKKEAIIMAKEFSDIQEVTEFYWFSREENYFTLVGTDSQQGEMIVIIPQTGESVTILDPAEGLTEDDALKKIIDQEVPERILKINLGIAKKKPSWEVVAENDNGTLDYFLIDFKSGDIVETIRNV